MYTRTLKVPKNKSFFLFGPRGTGKTTWLKANLPTALYFDLLDSDTYINLLAKPNRLGEMIPSGWKDWVVLDEVQRVPQVLYEVHRLIEERKLCFAITGSSARKLKRGEADMLAGRALTLSMFPLTAEELGPDFNLRQSLLFGHLPSIFHETDQKKYLESYTATYLREELQQEGIVRDLGSFSRFLETASFSQGQLLNVSNVASECSVDRKTVENYFTILEDLLIAVRIPVFQKKAGRDMVAHRKFFFFDTGVYRSIRPHGPLDTEKNIDGAALETLLLQELRAVNQYHELNYEIFFWRTKGGKEVDFVLYGEHGIIAIEVKRSDRTASDDFAGLRAFKKDYPVARAYMLTQNTSDGWDGDIRLMPYESFLKNLLSEITATKG